MIAKTWFSSKICISCFVEYADAAIEPFELDRNHSNVGVETDPPQLVDEGVDSSFAEFIEKAIDPDLDMTDVDWEVPPYLHRGTSPPPQVDPPPPPSPSPPPDTPSAQATPQGLPAPDLPPTPAPEPRSLFDIEDVVDASQIASEYEPLVIYSIISHNFTQRP